MQNNVRGLRIEPDVEFVPRTIDELGIVGSRVEACTHEHELFGQAGKFRIDRDSERQVGHGAAGVNCDLVRILADHAHQEVHSIFIGGFGSGCPFRHLSQLVGRMVELRCPCSQPGHRAIHLLPQFGLFFSPD